MTYRPRWPLHLAMLILVALAVACAWAAAWNLAE